MITQEQINLIERTRFATRKIWQDMSKKERTAFAKKCKVNRDRMQDFVNGKIVRLFAETEEQAHEYSRWLASRVLYILMGGEQYPG
jgi:hypothetical protein